MIAVTTSGAIIVRALATCSPNVLLDVVEVRKTLTGVGRQRGGTVGAETEMIGVTLIRGDAMCAVKRGT